MRIIFIFVLLINTLFAEIEFNDVKSSNVVLSYLIKAKNYNDKLLLLSDEGVVYTGTKELIDNSFSLSVGYTVDFEVYNGSAYVLSEESILSVVDLSSLDEINPSIKDYSITSNATALAISEDKIYIANSSNSIVVYDLDLNEIERVDYQFGTAKKLKINSNKIYALTDDSAILSIDLDTKESNSIKTSQARDFLINEDKLYVTASDNIEIYDTDTLKLKDSIEDSELLKKPNGVAIYSDKIFVVDEESEEVIQISLIDNRVTTSYPTRVTSPKKLLSVDDTVFVLANDSLKYFTSPKGDCEVGVGFGKLKPINDCSFSHKYEKTSEDIEFEFLINDKDYGVDRVRVTNACKVSNSETASIKYDVDNRSKARLVILDEGVVNLTCVYNNYIIKEQIIIGDITVEPNSAIIVVGKGSDSDKLKDAFIKSGNSVYKFLYSQDYSDEEIIYFNAFDEQKVVDIDIDGKLDNVVDSVEFNFDDIKNVIENQPYSTNPLLIYLIDHGTKAGALLIDEKNKIYANQLKIVLDEYQSKTKREIIVIIDSCYSGAFVDILESNNRVIISSGTKDELVQMSTSGINFTNYFIQNLSTKESLETSFNRASETYTSIVKNSHPQASFKSEDIKNSPFGFLFNANSEVIEDYTKSTKSDSISKERLFIKANDGLIDKSNAKAKAIITPPQTVILNIDSNATDVIELISNEIELTYDESSDEFSTNYQFQQDGIYNIQFSIEDIAKDRYTSDSINIQIGDSNSSIKYIKVLNIKKGWNLLALPTNQNISSSKFENFNSIWSYKDSNWSENPTTIKYGIGFWINSNIDKSYEFEGNSYKPDLNDLNGWNLLGTAESLSSSDFESNDIVWRFNSSWTKNKEINTAEGFWIKR